MQQHEKENFSTNKSLLIFYLVYFEDRFNMYFKFS